MQWSDLLIIYFSCGAPFAVYHFLQNSRNDTFSSRLLLNSAAVWVGWIAYAYLLWRKRSQKRFTPAQKQAKKVSTDPEIALLEQQTTVIQEQILQAFIETNSRARLKVQFFAFRDVLERFVGLTIAERNSAKFAASRKTASEAEVFSIAGRSGRDSERGARCVSRRNLARLQEHQKNAREDFLKQLANLRPADVPLNVGSEVQNFSALRELILELLDLLDVKLMERAELIFTERETVAAVQTNKSSNRLIEAAARN